MRVCGHNVGWSCQRAVMELSFWLGITGSELDFLFVSSETLLLAASGCGLRSLLVRLLKSPLHWVRSQKWGNRKSDAILLPVENQEVALGGTVWKLPPVKQEGRRGTPCPPV